MDQYHALTRDSDVKVHFSCLDGDGVIGDRRREGGGFFELLNLVGGGMCRAAELVPSDNLYDDVRADCLDSAGRLSLWNALLELGDRGFAGAIE